MPFLRNEFSKIFEDLFTMKLFTEMTQIYDQANIKKNQPEDSRLTLVKFCKLLAVKCSFENFIN